MIRSPSSVHTITLTGLDGTNPLGFLTALGTLLAVRQAQQPDACLRWELKRTWMPVLVGLTTNDEGELCERLAKALAGKPVSAEAEENCLAAARAHAHARTAIRKAKEEIKTRKLGKAERGKAIDELVRPLEAKAATKRGEWLDALRAAVPRPELALGARIDCTAREYRDHAGGYIEGGDVASREAIQYLAAFGSDACVEDGKGDVQEPRIEATPFCFIRGSGNQNFLDTVRKLLSRVETKRLKQTLFEPWAYRDEGLSMRWDPVEDKRYALTDARPADEGALTMWMANLLAYRSLALFPCAPTRQGLGTTAWADVDGERTFTWPIWEFAAGPDTVRTLLQLRDLREARPDRSALDSRGVAAAFRVRRVRFPPKGASYKVNFSPARGLL